MTEDLNAVATHDDIPAALPQTANELAVGVDLLAGDTLQASSGQPLRLDDAPQGLFILGMHRAGTSAVTRMVNLLGAQLPDNLLGKNDSNPMGHWESNDVIAMNDAMLRSARSSWDDIFDFDRSWFLSSTAKRWVATVQRYIANKLSHSPIFVIKDPRICLLFPIWAEALRGLNIEPLCIIPFRSPLEVAQSLAKRDFASKPGQFVPIDYGLLLWLRYVIAATRHSQGYRRSFVSFDALLASWEPESVRMGRQLGVVWPVNSRLAKNEISNFLSSEHRHHDAKGTASVFMEPVYGQVLDQLRANVDQPELGEDIFEQVNDRFLNSAQLFEMYVRSALNKIEATTNEVGSKVALVNEGTSRQELLVREITRANAEKEALADSLAQLVLEKQELAESLAQRAAENQQIVALHARELSKRQDELAAATMRIADVEAELTSVRTSTAGAFEHASLVFAAHVKDMTTRAREVAVAAELARADVSHLAQKAEALLEPEQATESAWHETLSQGLHLLREKDALLRQRGGRVRTILRHLTARTTGLSPGSQVVFTAELLSRFEKAEETRKKHEEARASRRMVERLALASEPRSAELESAAVVLAEETSRIAELADALVPKPWILENPRSERKTYGDWIASNDTISTSDRHAILARLSSLVYRPLISVIMPVFNPSLTHLGEAIESVRTQLYSNWELCIANDASTNPEVASLLAEAAGKDARIRVIERTVNGHICAASNSALTLASGEFVALLDHDDILREHALFEVVSALNDNRELDIIYSDEDHVDGSGQRSNPYFKTDFNQDLLLGHNFISHLGVYRRAIVSEIGGFRIGYEGSQDYDLALRAVDSTDPERIKHIQAVLYHWRQSSDRATFSESFMEMCIGSARKAISDHLRRNGIDARVVEHPNLPLWQRVILPLPSPMPLVSVIVPTRDKVAYLKPCLDGVLNRTDYPNLEVIVVNHESTESETLSFFDSMSKDERVRIVSYHGSFNYSAINNFAVSRAHGEVLAFLNNDVDVITEDWLREMVSLACSHNVGAVGAKLLYPDNRIQHAGVALGIGGVANHFHHLLERSDPGYFGRAVMTSTVAAVTAACLVLKKSAFLEVGGFEEDHLPVAFNDVDLCLKLRGIGYRNVWTPHAMLFHHESVSRGSDQEPEKKARFDKEVEFMKQKWGHSLKNDPFYNPNLSYASADFSLSFPSRREKPWLSVSEEG